MVDYATSGYSVGPWHAGFMITLRRNLVVSKRKPQTDLTKVIFCIYCVDCWLQTMIGLAFIGLLFFLPLSINL